ncbi:MAG: HAD family phosphatase [Cyclobacteriaceae bacterium]|nr:HAD family phosphatase [Cyclobacteriaceae bacterium HetDA_MAG_MS6]
MNKIGLIFDMDGVIVDNHKFHFQSWQKLSEKYNQPLDEDNYRKHMNGRTLDEVVSFLFGDKLDTQQAQEVGNEKEALYRELYGPHLTPTKGLLDFLDTCKNEQIPLVVGTSAPTENVDFTLDGLGIRHYFDDILDRRMVTKGKPHPEIYQKCAKAINRENANCIVFEDALSGIQAGKSAGSKIVALATSHDRSELSGDIIIDDFTQINLQQIQQVFSN